MGSYTYPVVNGSRTLTDTQLSEFSAKMLLSGRDFIRESESVFYLLAGGRILASDVGFEPGRRLHELYQPSFDTNYPLSIAWNHKSLSQIRSTSQALQDQGFAAITSLVEGNMLLWDSTLPRSKFQTVTEDNSTLQILQKRHTTNNNRQTFSDFSAQDVWIQKLSRLYQTINNTYSTSLSINGTPITNLLLQGMYLDLVSGSTYRIGVSQNQPVITLNGSASETHQFSSTATWTDQGATAVDGSGQTLSVSVSGDVVNLAALTGSTPYQVVYSSTDGFLNFNSEVRSVHVVDLQSPQIVALATAGGEISPVTMTVGDAIDPAVDTVAGYTVTDNMDPSPTVTVSHNINVNTAGSYSAVVTALDSLLNSATYTRVVNVNPPFTWHYNSPIYGYQSGNPGSWTPSYVSHTIAASGWHGPTAAAVQDPNLTFERPYSNHSAGGNVIGMGPNTLGSSFDHIVYDFTQDFANRAIVKSFLMQGQVLDSGSNRLALYVKGSNSSTGPWTTIAYLQSPYWPGLLNPPQTFSYNHPASHTTGNTVGYRYIAVGYGVVSGSLSTNTPDSGVSRICLTGDHFT